MWRSTVTTEQYSYYWSSQCLPSHQYVWFEVSVNWVMEEVMFTKYRGVNKASSIYRVTLYLPSHQWSLSLKVHCVISMDQAFTSTKCMMMLSNVVDIEYQKVTESIQWTQVIYYWAEFVMCCSLVFWPTLYLYELEWYIYVCDVLYHTIVVFLCNQCNEWM